MAIRHFNLRTFLRMAPHDLLLQYFAQKEIYLDAKTKKKERICEMIQALLEEARLSIEKDFQDIFTLSYKGATAVFLAEASARHIALEPVFLELESQYARAFFVFLHHPNIFETALLLSCRDTVGGYWKKTIGLPRNEASNIAAYKDLLAQKISEYLVKKEGRGKNCVIDYFECGEAHYFFAYPENYSQAHLHYQKNNLAREIHKPAQEMIFCFNAKKETLETHYAGQRKVIKELEKIFIETVLQVYPPENEQTVYDVDVLKNKTFTFKYLPEWGIERVEIVELGIRHWQQDGQPLLHIVKGTAQNNVFQELDRCFPVLAQDQRIIRHNVLCVSARIKVHFYPQSEGKRHGQRTFHIVAPDSCDLKQEGRDAIIREMLCYSGLEKSDDTQKLSDADVVQIA